MLLIYHGHHLTTRWAAERQKLTLDSVSSLPTAQACGSSPPNRKGEEMMNRKEYLERTAALLLLALSSSACVAQEGSRGAAPPTVAAAQSGFSDPFTYCAAMGTIDAPDERYVGASVPEVIIADLREKAEISEDAPADWVAEGTVWRCMEGEVWACFVGANLPCAEKADTSTTPQPQVEDFCSANPNAEIVPMAVAGRATIYEWRCVDGNPQVVRQIFEADAQGYLSDFWYELTPQ
jgi:hypothetical protein